MKEHLTVTDMVALEEKFNDIETVLSTIKLIEQAVIGGDIVQLSDINNALYMIENIVEAVLAEISNTLNYSRD